MNYMIRKYAQYINEEIDWRKIFSRNKIRKGDLVIILPRLLYYINKNHWGKEMKLFIGRKFIITRVENGKYYISEQAGGLYQNQPLWKATYFVYRDCIQKIEYNRVYSDIDPFGEETWEN